MSDSSCVGPESEDATTFARIFFGDHNANSGSGHNGGHKTISLLILLRFLSPNIPCAMVLRLIARSPRGPGLIAPVASRSFCSLSLSVGRPGPHAFAVRNGSARLARRDVHRVPLSTSVTIAKRPSCEGGTRQTWHVFPKNGRKILHRGQRAGLPLNWLAKSCFRWKRHHVRGAASRPQEFVLAARRANRTLPGSRFA